MTEFYDFDAARKDRPVLSFKIAGQTFRAKSVLAPAILESPPEEEIKYPWDRSVEFVRRILMPEDREKFMALIHDPDALLTTEELAAIVSWLIEKASGRPLGSRSTSGNGAAQPSTGLKGRSRGRAKTGEK